MIIVFIPLAIASAVVALGYIWQSFFGFFPLQGDSWAWAFKYTMAYGQPPGFIPWGILGAAAGIVAAILLLQMLVMRIGGATVHGGHDDKTLHGSARWAKIADVKKTGLWRKTGVVVGGWRKWRGTATLRDDGPEHVLCFAPPRSGKGTGLVIPTLLSWSESTVVHDIRGENHAKTAGWRASQGQRILKFDPTAESGSIRFNPLAEVRIGTGNEVADAQNIASMIIDPDGKGLADFWQKSGFAWLSASIIYTLYKVRQDENRVASLHDVDMVLTAPGEGFETVLDTMISFQAGTEAATALIQSAAQEMKDRAAQERSGVLSSSKIDLSLYRDPIVAKNTAVSDFRLTDLMHGDQPASLYIIVPPSDIDRLRPLLRILWNLLLRRLMQTYDASGNPNYRRRLLLMFDEFTSVRKLEIFEQSMAYMGGYGIKAFLIVQDLTQLQSTYGRDNAIMGLCKVKIAYAPNEVSTAKTLSEMCGKTTIVQAKRSRRRQAFQVFGGDVTDNLAEVGRPLLTPDECMRLKAAKKSRLDPTKIVEAGDMLTFVAGFPPILGRQPLYFFDKTLRARSEIPPVNSTPPDIDAADAVEIEPTAPPAASAITARLRAIGQQSPAA